MTTRIITGDCRTALAKLPDGSIDCCVTSPPYFGLRDYGVDGQLGLEATPDAFVAALVEVFRQVRRVLRDDGTLWLNLGDSYAGSGRGGNPTKESSTLQGSNATQEASIIRRARAVDEIGGTARDQARTNASRRQFRESLKAERAEHTAVRDRPHTSGVAPPNGLKAKDLIGIPWRVAFALQADGWWLRQDIIWSKPNPMPESVTDRCTKAHEYLFLLSKSERYHFDAEAISETIAAASIERLSQPNLANQLGLDRVPGKTNGRMKAVSRSGNKARKPASARGVPVDTGGKSSGAVAGSVPWEGSTRNKRSVWTVSTVPFTEAHFATFPPALIEPCIAAGCPAGGTVLDPFGGAGTTGLVADRLQRHAILIELNPKYAEMARRRIDADAPLLAAQ